VSILRAENIVLSANNKRILDRVSLMLPESGSVAIIGPNGAGKSSLLRIMAGIDGATSGEVLLDGSPLAALPGHERTRKIAYLPQQFTPHWDLASEDLVRLGLERIGPTSIAAVSEVMVRFDIAHFARQRWSTLSGGERARVLMAMELGTDPPILLADEPGASLDIRYRMSLVKMFALRGRNRLAVVVMHDLDLAFRHFDRIVVIAAGHIVADDTPEVLFDDPVLDDVFGVRFVRTETPAGRYLAAL
jgi:iron complex transport system ATP-binding protein